MKRSKIPSQQFIGISISIGIGIGMKMNEKEEKREDSGDNNESGSESAEEGDNAPLILLEPHHFHSAAIMTRLYKDLFHHYYAIKDWSIDTYLIQAYHGFIAVSFGEEYLLPEIQRTYCVLDWINLHIPHGAMNRLKKQYQTLSLRINTNLSAVLEGIRSHHGTNNWVNRNYTKVLTELFQYGPIPIRVGNQNNCSTFQFFTVELWEKTDERDVLISGEIGYRIGKIYTSLTGFSTHSRPSSGMLQLLALGILLRNAGYEFWNLGHPPRPSGMMKYKADIGGREISREEFLIKWRRGRDQNFPTSSIEALQSENVNALIRTVYAEQRDSKKAGNA